MSATAAMPDVTFRSVSLNLPVVEVAREMLEIYAVVDEDLGSARWHRQGGQIGAALKWGDDISVSRG